MESTCITNCTVGNTAAVGGCPTSSAGVLLYPMPAAVIMIFVSTPAENIWEIAVALLPPPKILTGGLKRVLALIIYNNSIELP